MTLNPSACRCGKVRRRPKVWQSLSLPGKSHFIEHGQQLSPLQCVQQRLSAHCSQDDDCAGASGATPPVIVICFAAAGRWADCRLRTDTSTHVDTLFQASYLLTAIILKSQRRGHFVTLMRLGDEWCLADDLTSDVIPTRHSLLQDVQLMAGDVDAIVSQLVYVRVD